MLIGYARVSKADGSQSLDLQRDALIAAGVDARQIYSDRASGKKDERAVLEACLKALRGGDVLVVWKLDRLGRSLHHLVKTVTMLSDRGIGLKVLTGQGAAIDTTTAAGRLSFGIFAALAEFESELIRERTMAGLQAARARGRKGGRTFSLTKAQVRTIQAAMAHRETSVSELCRELGITPVTLYRYVDPARKPSRPWQTSDRGLKCHLALSRNRPDLALTPRTQKQSGIVHRSPRRGGLDDPRSPGNTALGAVRKCGSGRSLGRDRQVNSDSVRACVGLLAESDLTPTPERRHRGNAPRRRALLGHIGSGGIQRQLSGGDAGTTQSMFTPLPADPAQEGCSPFIRAFTQPSTATRTWDRKLQNIGLNGLFEASFSATDGLNS